MKYLPNAHGKILKKKFHWSNIKKLAHLDRSTHSLNFQHKKRLIHQIDKDAPSKVRSYAQCGFGLAAPYLFTLYKKIVFYLFSVLFLNIEKSFTMYVVDVVVLGESPNNRLISK